MSQADSEDTMARIKRVTAEQERNFAYRRLIKDGGLHTTNIRRRLESIARERCIPSSEISKAMRGQNLLNFCQKHDLSIDWVMHGCLKGLLRTVEWQRSTTPEILEQQSKEVATLFKQLRAVDRTKMLNGLRRMVGAKA